MMASEMNAQPLKLGLIGLDTSHVVKFADILNNDESAYHIPGARIVAGFPGGSADLKASSGRVDGFTKQLKEQFNVSIKNTPEEVAEATDALLITSVDGRVHKNQFEAIAPYRKPVFMDKPFTCCLKEAQAIYELAQAYDIPLMSCSVLRYLDVLQEALVADPQVEGIDCYSPLELEPTNPGWFWYGIHGIEMMFRALGTHCKQVQAIHNEKFEQITAVWEDGRIGTVRGSRSGHYQYGATLHYANKSVHVSSIMSKEPMAVMMLKKVLEMFRTGKPDVSSEETLAIVRCIEAVNKSRLEQRTVHL